MPYPYYMGGAGWYYPHIIICCQSLFLWRRRPIIGKVRFTAYVTMHLSIVYAHLYIIDKLRFGYFTVYIATHLGYLY